MNIKENFGCIVSSCIVIVLGFALLVMLGYIPLGKSCGPELLKWRTSPTVDSSKSVNVFMWEYEPVETQYKDVNIKISSAFLEHRHYLKNDGIIIVPRVSELQLFFDNPSSLKNKGYGDNWLINDYLSMTNSGYVSVIYSSGSIPPDTLDLFIRECNPSLSTLHHCPSDYELRKRINWDTIRCMKLIRKVE